MSLLSFRSSSSGAAGVAGLNEGAYVTDGRRLFRVVGRLDPLRGAPTAVLEDCRTIEPRSYAAADLWEMRVRLVRPPIELRCRATDSLLRSGSRLALASSRSEAPGSGSLRSREHAQEEGPTA